MDMIEGVLLEGVDYVGKTTVSHRLADLMGRNGRTIGLGQCYLQRSPLIEFLEKEAKKSDDMMVRDYFYTAALVSDLSTLVPPREYRVQDRHWLTQLGRNAFFHTEEMVPARYLLEEHRPFTHNVLLTSSARSKRERTAGRQPGSPRDAYLAAHPEVHQEYEDFVTALLPADENWLVLDTTDCPVDEVARRILAYCGS
ncbi:hypothetical protein [Sinosporangium siamense]|uniref:Thymidylate kinase n=1 Tax=Sinosporangium siamense TaxID=1367973 RepID=A0A919RAW0_9ACTN|nr:hypothetical protein [Sinosporangium siamense]GII90132.1 hypothetical protein Ssi02_03630 [Sinosporangium siamense]